MNTDDKPEMKSDGDSAAEVLKRGREAAKIEGKSASDYIADAKATGMCTCGVTLGK